MCLYTIIHRRLNWARRNQQLRKEEKRIQDNPQFTDPPKVAIKTANKTTNEEQREKDV